MLKPEQIPHEAMKAFYEQMAITINPRDAIAAALNAWPGMELAKHLSVRDDAEGYCLKCTGIHLPLPTQENGDEA